MESGQVVALTLLHGTQIWRSPAIAGCDPSQPSVSGNYVVVGGGGTDVTALNAADGTVSWHRSFGSGCGLSAEDWIPAISNGRVYVGLISRGVAALSLTSGAIGWHDKSLGSSVFFPLSLTSGEVIVGATDTGQIAALKQSDGSIIWQATPPGGGLVAQLATFGSLAWGLDQPSSGGSAQLVAFDPLTGSDVYLGTSSPDDVQGFSPTVSAGHVLVNLGNEVVCLALPGAG
jgi:outer membrane protein assembly factor BamB